MLSYSFGSGSGSGSGCVHSYDLLYDCERFGHT